MDLKTGLPLKVGFSFGVGGIVKKKKLNIFKAYRVNLPLFL